MADHPRQCPLSGRKLGDLRAQVAACHLGIRRYGELSRATAAGRSRPASPASGTRRSRRAPRRREFPDGIYQAESFLDNDGRKLDVPLRVKVT